MVILKFVTDEAVEVSFPLRTFIVYRPEIIALTSPMLEWV